MRISVHELLALEDSYLYESYLINVHDINGRVVSHLRALRICVKLSNTSLLSDTDVQLEPQSC